MLENRTSVGLVDITSAKFLHDPVAGFEQLRREGPLSWQPAGRCHVPTGYIDSAQALRNPALVANDVWESWRKISRKTGTDFSPALSVFKKMPFALEGKRHVELRTALAKATAPYADAHHIFESRVKRLLSAARRDGGFDLAQHFTASLLFEIVCDLIELPETDRSEVRPLANVSWALDTTLSLARRIVATNIIGSCLPTLLGHVETKLRCPGSSLVHRLVSALPEGEEDKIRTTAYLLGVILMMGNDPLAGCINFAVEQLLGDSVAACQPPQNEWGTIADDAIRFSAPVGYVSRQAVTATAVGGCPVKAGDKLVISPLAANHDPATFGPDPSKIMPREGLHVGLAFAAGPHVCVGMRMSRHIVRCAFERLSELPEMKLIGPAQRGPGFIIRTLNSLPVELH